MEGHFCLLIARGIEKCTAWKLTHIVDSGANPAYTEAGKCFVDSLFSPACCYHLIASKWGAV